MPPAREERIRAILRSPLSLLPRSARVSLTHALRRRKELRRARACDLVVLSRAKSGRTWLRTLLSRLYQKKCGLPEAQLLEFDNFHKRDAAVPKILFTHGRYLAERIEASGRRPLRDQKVIFLVRHPCDVAVSEYFQSTRRARQYKVELYGVDKSASMFEFVMTSGLGLPAIIDYLNGWERRITGLGKVQVVRYEALRAEPLQTLRGVMHFFGTDFSDEEIREAVDFASFENLQELERKNFFKNSRLAPRDPSDPDSFKVRRGKVGGYRDYFDGTQLAQMDELLRTRLSPGFGYGKDADAGGAAG